MIYQLAVSFSLGIVCGQILNFKWAAALFIFLVSLVLFLYFRKFEIKTAKIILVIGLSFCLGVLRFSFADVSPDQTLAKLVEQKISFEATITEEPDMRDASARYTVKPNFLEECVSGGLARLTEPSTRKNSAEFYPCPQKDIPKKSLVLLVAERFPEFKYGDHISVSGRLELPKNFTGDNGVEFDYVSYLAKDKIHFLIYRPKIEKLGEGGGSKIITSLYSLKNNFIKNISEVVPEPNSSFIGGLLFGVKQSLGEDLLDAFKKAGLIHMVVLSGYNMTVVATAVLYVASYFNRRNLGFGFSLVVLFLFSLTVGLGATVIRASIMASIALLAKHLGRPNDALRALFLAGILMLLFNPLTLLGDPSFQLSFMATLGLILFSTPIENFLAKQKFIPNKFALREIAASTLAVQLFILPLLIKMSGFVSFISFLANIIILPLVPTIMLFGFLTGLLGFVPFLGFFLSWPFGAISYALTQIIILLTEFFANISLATISVGSVSAWFVFLWYISYGVLYFKTSSRSSRSELPLS